MILRLDEISKDSLHVVNTRLRQTANILELRLNMSNLYLVLKEDIINLKGTGKKAENRVY